MKTVLILLMSLLLPVALFAQWTPYVTNYDKSLFGKGSQVWQIAPSDGMFTYFANQNGVVQFDGTRWNLLPLNNGAYVRSVYVSHSDNRVYVGGVNEYGWLEADEIGRMTYKCVSDSLKDELRYLGNIWSIQQTATGVFFIGDSRFVRLYKGEITMTDAWLKMECSAVLDDVLYLGSDRGVYMLIGKNLYPLQGGELLANKRIRGIIPVQHDLLIATDSSELYYYRKGILTPYELPKDVKTNDLFCITANDKYIAIGTILHGIYLIETASGNVLEFNENNGMQNSTVLSLSFDHLGNLWAGLDSGIDYIYLNMPCTNLYTSRNTCGAGYDAAVDGNTLYLGTNRGLYYTHVSSSFKPDVDGFTMVSGTGGQVWNLTRVGDDLFCAHDRGLMLVKDHSVQTIGNLSGVWCCQPVVGHKDMLYVGTYDGLYLLRKEKGKWILNHRVEGEGGSFQIFEQESANEIWLHNGRTVSCLKINDSLTAFVGRTDYTEQNGLPKGNVNHVSKIRGRIYFSTNLGVYKFNHHSNLFEPASDFNDLLNGQLSYLSLQEYATGSDNDVSRIISMTNDEIFLSNLTAFKNAPNASTLSVPIYQSLISVAPNYAKVVPVSDTLFILPNDKGFALFDISGITGYKAHVHPFAIKSVTSTTPEDSILYEANFVGVRVEPTLDYEMNSLRFNFESKMVCTDNVKYRYRLSDSPWSPWSSEGKKEYSDLREGSYTFEVEALIGSNDVERDSIKFSIRPPWYRSLWANIFYMLVAFFLIASMFMLERFRVISKERIIEKKKDEQLAEREREFEIQQQQHKAQEMANLMINLARKNEMLTEIKEEIIHVVSSLKAGDVKGSSRELLMLNNKIDSNIENDDLLKRVEEQFDLVHNNFMQRLSERHPDLSNNERMMCAYLKMNLSTKEIAPLLNISVRGVESMRYRLRKKIGLDRDEGLISYLKDEFE